MKILVTGGSGYLGTHVRAYFNADDLSRRSGHDVLNTSDAEMAADYDLIIHLAGHLDKDERCHRAPSIADADAPLTAYPNNGTSCARRGPPEEARDGESL